MKIQPSVSEVAEYIKKTIIISKQNQTLSNELFDNGWYPIKFVSRVEKSTSESINEFMERVITIKYDQLKEYCYEIFPLRKEILKEAFNLFDCHNYIACIPLFLIQTDGIARDYGSKGMFVGKSKNFEKQSESKFLPYVNKFANVNVTRSGLFRVLHSEKFVGSDSYSNLMITKCTEKSNPDENFCLNRHGILHGLIEYMDYANILNALRTISFMVYTINLGEDMKLILKENI